MTELFKDFEVNWEQRGPLVLKLVAWSVLVHILSIACLMYIPGVRNVLNIAGLIADTSFVDKDYERTVIGDDVQFVQLTGEKFRYPDGYWALEGQPGVVMPPPPPPPSQIIVQSQPAGPVQAPTPPLPEPSATPTPLVASPSPVPTGSPSQAVAQTSASPSPSPSPGLDDAKLDQAQKELDKIAKANNLTLPKEGEINKKALKDFAAYANDLKNQGKLDLNKPFEIVIEAVLDETGKLKDPKFTKKEGDPNLVDLFGRMVGALNDSGFLIYLKAIDKDNPGMKVVFTIKQGEKDVLASVESEAASDDSAHTLAKGFNTALAFGADSRAGKDEEVLLRNTTVEPNGKKIIFNFTMPRQAMVDFIKKQLAAG
jgi:hypothetical protein